MEDSQQTRRMLRGKIIMWRPLIERGLNEWESYNNSASEQLWQRLQALAEEVKALESRQKLIYKDQAEAETALREQNKSELRFQELTVQFHFVSELAQLQTQRQVLQEGRDELVRIILKTAVEYIPANKNQHKLDKEN